MTDSEHDFVQVLRKVYQEGRLTSLSPPAPRCIGDYEVVEEISAGDHAHVSGRGRRALGGRSH